MRGQPGEAFVIGGGMAKAGEMLLNVIRKYYRQYAFPASRETEFRFAELGNSAGIYGGVRMVLEFSPSRLKFADAAEISDYAQKP